MVSAHPGGIAYGRAICGSEYTTPEEPYIVPDIAEAWYLRKIATCEHPYFWTKFEIAAADQPLYIAAISPQIARFQDKIRFNAILYGPGVSSSQDGMREVPAVLPAGITRRTGAGFEEAAYMTSPADLSVCDFVKTNPVMRNFAKEVGGRCMEELDLPKDYKDAIQADTTTFSWWLYSFNHRAAQPGTYYLQSWLTDSVTNATAQGKYEVTLGPWTWSGYASQAVEVEAQSQGTDCSCAVNAQSYKENYPERLGNLDPQLYVEELPGGSCDASPPPATTCVTQARMQYLSEDSAIEWAGIFELSAGRTYEWTFRAYFDGAAEAYGYPDPGMDVFITPASSLAAATAAADAALKVAPASTVSAEETLAIKDMDEQTSQLISFTDPAVASSTRVLLQPTVDGDVAVLTQHVPTEFMAHFLVDRASGEYVFPKSSTLYGELGDVPEEEEETPTASPALPLRTAPWLAAVLAAAVLALAVRR